jgi:predicted DNA-binding transcriptional regulator AlpA
MDAQDVLNDDRRMLDGTAVCRMTCQSPSSLWGRIRSGQFPKPDATISQHRY